jgi:glycosyltransferase involved in cell wall biosynthesis
MISVLHVHNSNYPGGIGTTLLGWFAHADRSRFIPRLFVFRERQGLHERSVSLFKARGLEPELLPWGHARNLPGAVRRLVREIRANPRTVLHSHDTRSDLVAVIAARLTGAPLIISNHAWHPADLKRKVLESIRARLMRHADLVISVSRNTNQETLDRGIPARKCACLYSGVDVSPYRQPPPKAEARAALGLNEDDIVIGNVARLWPEKEQASLIEAAAVLAPDHPRIRFLIVGDGPLETALRAQISRLGLERQVLMPGYREDLVSVMAAIDIFAFPSSAEGTPMVIYDAMAIGLPIVASPVSGVGELLVDEQTALFVPPADSTAMAQAIERLLADTSFARALGARAREVVESEYAVEQAVGRLERIYEQLVEGRPDIARQ